jgi:hypothetical protein
VNDWPRPIVCGVVVPSVVVSLRESFYSLLKDNILYNNYTIFETLVILYSLSGLYVWKLVPRHTYYEHSILALKPNVTYASCLNPLTLFSLSLSPFVMPPLLALYDSVSLDLIAPPPPTHDFASLSPPSS